MKICFVLPQILRQPIGGYKMVYEYANHLQNEGYDVDILFINDNALTKYKLPEWIRLIGVKLFTFFEPRWFNLNKRVRKLSTTDKTLEKKIETIDLAIATGVNTVEKVLELFPDTKKSYFIQDHETWVFDEDRIIGTYKLDIDKIVISSWLKSIVDKYSPKESILMKNPIDVEVYRLKKNIEERDKHTIGVLFHVGKHKGFEYSYKAICRLKQIYPDLKVKMFGTSIPSIYLPNWINFTLKASKEETVDIYNDVTVFICSTINEGFGLTGLEAMSCGAVLVSSDYAGVREYANNDFNALLSTPKDIDALVNNVRTVFEDEKLKNKLSKNGIEQAKTMTWNNTIQKLRSYLDSIYE